MKLDKFEKFVIGMAIGGTIFAGLGITVMAFVKFTWPW